MLREIHETAQREAKASVLKMMETTYEEVVGVTGGKPYVSVDPMGDRAAGMAEPEPAGAGGGQSAPGSPFDEIAKRLARREFLQALFNFKFRELREYCDGSILDQRYALSIGHAAFSLFFCLGSVELQMETLVSGNALPPSPRAPRCS